MRFFIILVSLLLGASALAEDAAVPAAVYFPVLPFDALPEQAPQLVPVAANHALDGAHADITRAIIVIHDQGRDAGAALATLSALAGAANATTLIIAPQFLLSSDIARFADHLPERGRAFASWQMAGWPQGDDAIGQTATQAGTLPTAMTGRKTPSSFTVVDLLMMYLSDRDAFPHLQTIIVAGFGAGGVFVQHYAAFGMAADIIAKQNIDLRYVVADAPSYLYLTATRPLGGRKGFGQPDFAACPGVNFYPYGLDMLNAYARHVGANAAKTGYGLRHITYLNAPGSDPVPDTNCAALAQGADGASRAANYRIYLHSLYSDTVAQTQSFSVPQQGGNNPVDLFGSPCGMSALFGDGVCAASGLAPQ